MSTEIAYHVVRRRLSADRFGPYETATGGDVAQAFELYEWNMEASAAVFHSIGMLEVVLRNALSDQLAAAFPSTPDWYRSVDLDQRATDDVDKAVWRATNKGTTAEIVSKVVAELNFGFWRFLLTRRYHTPLWVRTLHRAFPHHPSAVSSRRDIENRLEHLYFLRNRVAHHEPVHRRNLLNDYAELLDVAGWICPDTQAWISACSHVTAVVAQRPQVTPPPPPA